MMLHMVVLKCQPAHVSVSVLLPVLVHHAGPALISQPVISSVVFLTFSNGYYTSSSVAAEHIVQSTTDSKAAEQFR